MRNGPSSLAGSRWTSTADEERVRRRKRRSRHSRHQYFTSSAVLGAQSVELQSSSSLKLLHCLIESYIILYLLWLATCLDLPTEEQHLVVGVMDLVFSAHARKSTLFGKTIAIYIGKRTQNKQTSQTSAQIRKTRQTNKTTTKLKQPGTLGIWKIQVVSKWKRTTVVSCLDHSLHCRYTTHIY